MPGIAAFAWVMTGVDNQPQDAHDERAELDGELELPTQISVNAVDRLSQSAESRGQKRARGAARAAACYARRYRMAHQSGVESARKPTEEALLGSGVSCSLRELRRQLADALAGLRSEALSIEVLDVCEQVARGTSYRPHVQLD